MNLFSLLAGVELKKDLWTILIKWFQGSVVNVGWTILLVTLFVKLVTIPLDFMVRLTTKKQTLIQQKCAPQVAKLQKKFGADRQRLQAQTQALYKKEGLNTGTGCIVQLVNMILSMVIFFTFYSSLQKFSAYEAINQYETIENTFNDASIQALIDYEYANSADDIIIDKASANQFIKDYEAAFKFVNDSSKDKTSQEYLDKKAFVEKHEANVENAAEFAVKASQEKWEEIKPNWLWIENVWVADATTNVFPDYASLKKMASNAGGYYKDYVNKNISEGDYKQISNIIQAESRKYNGYYILAVLAGVITLASQFISDFHTKLKNKRANTLAKATNQNAASLKIIKFILPITMILFVLTSSASFGIYLLASNIASIATGELIALIVNRITRKRQLEVEEELEKEATRLIKKGKLQE